MKNSAGIRANQASGGGGRTNMPNLNVFSKPSYGLGGGIGSGAGMGGGMGGGIGSNPYSINYNENR